MLEKMENLLWGQGWVQTLEPMLQILFRAFAPCHRGSTHPDCRASPEATASSSLSKDAWFRCPPSPCQGAIDRQEDFLGMLPARIAQLLAAKLVV